MRLPLFRILCGFQIIHNEQGVLFSKQKTILKRKTTGQDGEKSERTHRSKWWNSKYFSKS